MLIFKNNNNLEKLIIGSYFIVASVEVIAELFSFKPIIFIFKPLIPLLLMLLYWNTSNQRNALFFVTISFSLMTNIFFIPNTEKMLFFGIIAFLIYQLLTIFYIIKLIKLKDYVPVLLAMIPFLLIFFYLFFISDKMPQDSSTALMIQNILVSILGGIALSDYTMNDNKKNVWLFIFSLLSVTRYFIVFIEKCYLSDVAPIVFRPIAMILSAVIYYSFYKFVLEIEKSNSGSENLYNN